MTERIEPAEDGPSLTRPGDPAPDESTEPGDAPAPAGGPCATPDPGGHDVPTPQGPEVGPGTNGGGSNVVARASSALTGNCWKRAAEVATVLGLIVAIIGVLVAIFGVFQDRANAPIIGSATPGSTPSTAPRPEDPLSTAPTPGSGDFVLYDDFSTPTLDPTKWTGAAAAAPFVSVADGALRVQAGADQGDENSAGVQAVLTPTAEALRFRMTVRSVDGINTGGAYAHVLGASGRFHEIWGGPNGAGTPTIGYALCETQAPCVGYDAFTLRSELVAQIGRPIEVVVRSTGAGWQIKADGRPWTRAVVEQGAIEGLWIGVYSFGGGFSVEFDDVYVDHVS